MRSSLSILPLLAAAAAFSSQAAIVGPDSFGYSATDGVAYSFQSIATTGTKVLAGVDDSVAAAPIGFDFSFYGTRYATAWLSSNGLISFGYGNAGYTNQDLTASQFAGGPAVFSYWDDLVTYNNPDHGVYYETRGAVGSRTFIVEEIANRYGFGGNTIDFQTVFSEANGSVLVRYLTTTFGIAGIDQGASATVGIQGDLGAGQVVQWNVDGSNPIANNSSLCFSVGGAPCDAPLAVTASAVPEPQHAALLGIGLMGALVVRRRKDRAGAA